MLQVYMPAGEFLMGSDKTKDSLAHDNELPQHTVTLDAFWIDQTEVTNAMFSAFIQASHYQTDAEKAGWAYVYEKGTCNKVNGANWQHPQGLQSNLQSLEKHPVVQVSWNDAQAYCLGSYPAGASPYGALDMAGNVEEWVNDWFSGTYYQQSPGRNPPGPTSGTYRGLRGGSLFNGDGNVRSAFRSLDAPDYWVNNLGFRCVASP